MPMPSHQRTLQNWVSLVRKMMGWRRPSRPGRRKLPSGQTMYELHRKKNELAELAKHIVFVSDSGSSDDVKSDEKQDGGSMRRSNLN